MRHAKFSSHFTAHSGPILLALGSGTHVHQLSGLPCAPGQAPYPNPLRTWGRGERRELVRYKAVSRESWTWMFPLLCFERPLWNTSGFNIRRRQANTEHNSTQSTPISPLQLAGVRGTQGSLDQGRVFPQQNPVSSHTSIFALAHGHPKGFYLFFNTFPSICVGTCLRGSCSKGTEGLSALQRSCLHLHCKGSSSQLWWGLNSSPQLCKEAWALSTNTHVLMAVRAKVHVKSQYSKQRRHSEGVSWSPKS